MIHDENNHSVGETKATNSGTVTILPGVGFKNYHNI